MKDLLNKMHLENEYNVISRAVSLEEIGNDIYPPMKNELYKQGIPFNKHQAQRIAKQDYDWADVIYYMDNSNLNYLNKLLVDTKNKIKPIYQYTPSISYIEDPWYTDRYNKVIKELTICIKDIINNLK